MIAISAGTKDIFFKKNECGQSHLVSDPIHYSLVVDVILYIFFAYKVISRGQSAEQEAGL